jgi:hypothetical protein
MLANAVRWFLLASALMSLAGCTDQQAGSSGAPKSGKPAATSSKSEYPISRSKRNYRKVHENVEQAWFLVETSYFVVSDQLEKADRLIESVNNADVIKGVNLKSEYTKRVQNELFGINASVKQLFEDAIKAEPDNPLNMVAYAVYLKPRRTRPDDPAGEQFDEALAMMDDAIKLWPDEASFYYLKAYMMVSMHMVHNYSRSTFAEDFVVSQMWAEVRDLLAKAEKYDPANAQINYYRAQIVMRTAPPHGSEEAVQEALREIKAGNAKRYAYQYFPPPLDPFYEVASMPTIDVNSDRAVYYDQWHQFGRTDSFDIEKMLYVLGNYLELGKNKQDVAAVMFMLYKLGRVRPYGNAYFHMQQLFLENMQGSSRTTNEDKLLLGRLMFTLSEYYNSACSRLTNELLPIDPKEYGAVGLGKIELGMTRNQRIRQLVQPFHAAYLKEVGKILDVEMPLSSDSNTWGD